MTPEVSLSDLLGAEHHRLEALWSQARAALDQAAPTAALNAFDDGLRRHIRDEEEVLFPAFEARTGMGPQGGPTAVMRLEHRQLETLLAALTGTADGAATHEITSQAAAALSRLIADHDAKEEGMLYPMMDRAFRAAEKTALVGRLDAAAESAKN